MIGRGQGGLRLLSGEFELRIGNILLKNDI